VPPPPRKYSDWYDGVCRIKFLDSTVATQKPKAVSQFLKGYISLQFLLIVLPWLLLSSGVKSAAKIALALAETMPRNKLKYMSLKLVRFKNYCAQRI